MSKLNNKWPHGKTNFIIPRPAKGVIESMGVYNLTVGLDKTIGEEVILIIYDPTDFIDQLKAVKPFRFNVSSLAVNTSFGPVFSFLFYITHPGDEKRSVAIYDKPLDISNPKVIEPWVKLANQTHLHLLLVDKNYDVQGFYEFDNDFCFDEAVDTIARLDATKVKDYQLAETEYFNNYELMELFEKVRAAPK